MFAQRTKFTRTSGPLVVGFVGLLMFGVSAFGQTGEADSPASLDDVTSFSLTPFYQEGGGGSDDWDVSGPVRMRSADPEETGELQIKNIFGYSTSSDGSDDDWEYELELEWGFLPNHHMILELPVELGDGEVEGNGDITLGWHWRLWTEQDWIPAFAMRNLVRLPSGVDSDGVDYEFRGLFTKSITPNQLRLQFSPSFKVVNGDIHDGDRSFQWEVYAGFDYRLSEAAALNLAYLYGSSESNGAGDQHSIELGLDWDIAEHRMLAFGTKLGLDGDDEGDNWGFKVSYIFSLDAPSFGG